MQPPRIRMNEWEQKGMDGAGGKVIECIEQYVMYLKPRQVQYEENT